MDIDAALAALSLEQKVTLLTGADYWRTHAFPEAGIDAIMLADGPHGLRVQTDASDHLGLNESVPATCFPTPAALATTWDEALLEEIGAAIGDEARAQGVQVVLGPGTNIKRDPRCGRNFEYFSEDPLQSGTMAAAVIRGLQSRGIAACLKHFAVNNQETDRLRVSAEVDERTLREIYLASFEHAIRLGSPWSIMSSYNRINGRYAGESRWLLTDVLRDEWGWDGTVVSDWGAVFDRVATLDAGLDLEMPYSGGWTQQELLDAVADGTLDEARIDESVRRLLQLIDRVVVDDAATADFDAHHALARRAAAAGCVLLRNAPVRADGAALLPLQPADRLAVIGEFARTPRFQGAGAAQVVPTRLPSVLDALAARGIEHTFAPGFRFADEPDDALTAEAVAAAGAADVAVVFLGLPPSVESEGYDRPDIDLPANQLALLEAVRQVAPRVVVVLAGGGVVRLGRVHESSDAVLQAWLGGQAMAEGVVDVLLGDVNPSGKLSETVPVRLEDCPSYLSFPGELGESRYGEGIFVGYRGHDRRDAEVTHAFGFGLSYTTFEVALDDVDVEGSGSDARATVRASVTNTGDVRGAEVVQVYVGDPVCSVARPPRELRAFARVELDPGETRSIELALDSRAFAHWHPRLGRFVVEGGEFVIDVGTSSRDIVGTATLDLSGDDLRQPLTEMSTIGELMADDVIGPDIRRILETQPAQFQAQAPDIPAITFVDFNIFELDRDGLRDLLDRANQAHNRC